MDEIQIPDYSIMEIFQEVIDDDSWEPDMAVREATINSMMFGLYM